MAAASVAVVAMAATRASAGTSRSATSTTSWIAQVAGSVLRSHVAANRAQPLSSPASQPIPSAIGAQPRTARPTRTAGPG